MSKPKGKAKGPQLAPAWELNTRDGIRRERERVLGQGCRAKPGGGGTIEEPEDTSLRTQSGGRDTRRRHCCWTFLQRTGFVVISVF